MNFGKAIKKIRKERLPHLTQTEFGRVIGITQTYLSQLESGSRYPSIQLLKRISKEFQIPVQILFWYSIGEEDIKPRYRKNLELVNEKIDPLFELLM